MISLVMLRVQMDGEKYRPVEVCFMLLLRQSKIWEKKTVAIHR
jgi:hypothetical protein